MTELPNAALHGAIRTQVESAGVLDPDLATAKAIEAWTKGEFSDADQVASWLSLQRVRQPNLWSASTDGAADFAEHGAVHATAAKGKGEANPWASNYKGTDKERYAAIEAYIKAHGSAASARMASSAGTVVGRPLMKAA